MDWVNPRYFNNGSLDGRNETLDERVSVDGVPLMGHRYLIPARRGRAVRLGAGDQLRLINTHGTQVCDLWAFVAANTSEHMSMEHVRARLSRTTPRAGDELVTNRRRAVLKMVEDTSPGVHDTLIAACDLPRYRTLGVKDYHDNCTDNLRMALMAIGASTLEIPSPLNVWMNNPVSPGGEIDWKAPVSKAGDQVVFRALLDCIVVMSACPQDMVPVNGDDCLPTELAFEVTH